MIVSLYGKCGSSSEEGATALARLAADPPRVLDFLTRAGPHSGLVTLIL